MLVEATLLPLWAPGLGSPGLGCRQGSSIEWVLLEHSPLWQLPLALGGGVGGLRAQEGTAQRETLAGWPLVFLNPGDFGSHGGMTGRSPCSQPPPGIPPPCDAGRSTPAPRASVSSPETREHGTGVWTRAHRCVRTAWESPRGGRSVTELLPSLTRGWGLWAEEARRLLSPGPVQVPRGPRRRAAGTCTLRR